MSTSIFPTPFISGPRLIDGSDLNRAFANPVVSSQDAITAHAGGGQTHAFQLTATFNRVSVVASSADSVKLPDSLPGSAVFVSNDAANAMQVYGFGTDTINDIAYGTGISQAAGSSATYYCTADGKWYQQGAGSGAYTGTFDGVVGGNTPAAGTFTTFAATTGSFSNDVTIATGKAIKTDTTTAHTLLLQAYDVDGVAYKTFITLTNGNTPSLSLAAPSGGTVAIDGAVIGGVTAAAATFTTLGSGNHTLTEAANIVVGTATGTKIGTATSQKLGFFNSTPIIQPVTTGTVTGYTSVGGSAVLSQSTFTGNTGSAAYTIGDVVLALKNLGFLAA